MPFCIPQRDRKIKISFSMNGPLLTVKLLAVIYSKALCGLGVFVLHNEQNASGFHLHTELHLGHFADPADYLCLLKMELPEAKKT